jgi:putative salt-induced outer membrane protein
MLACLGVASVIAAQVVAAQSEDVDLPAGVAEMIDTALQSGDKASVDAVVRIARQAHPQAATAIDQRVATWLVAHGQQTDSVMAASISPAAPPPPAASPPPEAPPAFKWSGEGELGAFANTGNAPGIGFIGGLKLLMEGENWRIGSTARADYQETANVVTREQYRFTMEPNYQFGPKAYLYGLGQYERDRFQGFSARYSVSGGLGYRLFNDDAAKINVKAGPAWRETNGITGVRESVVAGLASVDMKVKLSRGLQFSQDASAYVDAEGSTLYTLAALDSQLIGKLKARFSYMVQYESAPETGRRPTDTTSRLTLVYGF